MNHKPKSVTFTLWANRALMLVVAALVPLMPGVLRWYASVRFLADNQDAAIRIAFYCCVPVVLLALWCLDRLLRNIRAAQVFTYENTRLIGRVCLCCAAVSLICLPAAWFYPPLIFMSVIMGFLCPVIWVVRLVIRAAVEIREENDLTI